MSGKPKIFGHLMAEVIRKNLCVGCGACEAVCPVNSIQLVEGTPKLVGMCIACGMCYNNCPRSEFEIEDLEMQVFGRARNEEEAEIGVLSACYAVRAKDGEILERCQDGGAVTAILSNFLDDGGECAVVAGLEKEKVWVPTPMVALSKEELALGAGTKYTPSPTLVGLASAVSEYGKGKVAVVGTPCQMRALRRIETGEYSDAKIREATDLAVGLFCMETFNYNSLMAFLEKEGVDASKVTKFDIKKGKFIAYRDDEAVYSVKLSKLKEQVRPCCHICDDFASEFADISVGNVGSPDGWSTVVVRTERGEEILKSAEKGGFVEVKPLEEVKPGLNLVVKLANTKKKGAKKVE